MGLIETKEKGFTLIELLVVIAIIAMLSSVVMAGFSDTKQKGRDAARVRALQEVRSALQLYATDKGGFPPGTNILGSSNLLTELAVNNKYIASVDSSLRYSGVNSDGTYCNPSVYTVCSGYHIGIALERRDSGVLVNDSNSILPTGSGPGTAVIGTNDTCGPAGVVGGTPVLCYDILQ
ncbi:MAG: type II secretion system protein [Candidatus Paceibacterota bacterium]|jgi:prepilin-type N-terminal cleavage/methylation domain-containing protein